MSELTKRLENLSQEKQELFLRALAVRSKRASDTVEHEATSAASERIPPRDRSAPTPLSFGQERLWFLERLQPGSSAYNLFTAFEVEGRLEVPVLHAAIREIVRRHEVLRTIFVANDGAGGEPEQAVLSSLDLNVPMVDITNLAPAERSREEILRSARVIAFAPYNLSSGPLLRVSLLRVTAQWHVVVLATHHIISDAWSYEIFHREISFLYQAFVRGGRSPLADLAIQYGDFAAWQRVQLQGEHLERLVSYWKGRLEGASRVLDLPTDRPRPAHRDLHGGRVTVDLKSDLTAQLRELARRSKATLFMTVLAVFKVLLARYSDQKDINVGTFIAGHNQLELEGVIGFFINNLVLRTDLSGDPSFVELLERVRSGVREDFAHQELPFERVVAALETERDMSYTPLFQAAINLLGQRLAAPAPPRRSSLAIKPLRLDRPIAIYDVGLALNESDGGLGGWLEYTKDLFDHSTLVRMVSHLNELAHSIVTDPEEPISALSLLTVPEKAQLLREWNDSVKPCSQEPMVHELFSQHAARAPHHPAMVSRDGRLSYGELEARSNRLARHLAALGVGPEVLVAMCTGRTLDRAVGILGVIKAGGAYVSIDPTHPAERLAFVLADAGAAVILTEERYREVLPPSAARTIFLDTDWERIEGEEARPPESGLGPENLAYVVYTSGSTGKPKGVAIPHAGLMNLVRWHQDLYRVVPDDRGTQVASPAFDASIWEFWPYLAGGASLDVPDEETRLSSPGMIRWWAERGTTLAYLMTPLAEGVLEEKIPPELELRVRALIIGGDRLHRGPDPRVGFRLMNHYGPAEYSVTSTVVEVPPRTEDLGQPTIGRTIDNTEIYLLDRHLGPVPIGVPAELFVAGVGLARGYLQRPALTAEKILPHPFSEAPGSRMYRTADLVRRLPDGDMDFLGRLDHQVKIRGLRVELGEIESALNDDPAVREAVVLLHEDAPGQQRLVAFLVPSDGHVIAADEMRESLRERLPAYMIPTFFISLERLPLSPNGKVDRDELGRHPLPAASQDARETAPAGGLEKRLAAFWAELLGLEQVAVHDNFFDLGGHSILIMRLQEKILEEIGVDVPITDMFQYATAHTLAEYLETLMAPTASDDASTAPDDASRAPGDVPTVVTRAEQRSVALTSPSSGIAIIGMAGRFPGAGNVEEFWANLCGGVESIRSFSEEELREAGFRKETLQNPYFVNAMGHLEGSEYFDAGFFGYSHSEAQLMDPQQRVFLECSWHALEDAGYGAVERLGAVGVFAGTSFSTYLVNLVSEGSLVGAMGGRQTLMGNDKDNLATRVAYKLDLKGPSFTVQTACSTSLVATHLACQSLRLGECDLALAGGVSISVPSKGGYIYEEGGILSPDGHCRVFDARAGGTVDGSGAGVVVLKRLEEALADGDPVYAVIRGSAINNDGSLKVGYTAPSVEGQASVIAEAQEMAAVDPDRIGYVEAHGTGTRLGDPIEIRALTWAFRRRTNRTGYCGIGSVKSNVGHLDAAAGVTGLIKAALAVERGQIPPSVSYESANPELGIDSTPFFVVDRLRPWPADSGPRVAGVSSFGIGGTNAHVVLEEAPSAKRPGRVREWQLFVLSARSDAALETQCSEIAEHLEKHPELDPEDVSFTLQVGRERFEHRCAVVCRGLEDATAVLKGEGEAAARRLGRREEAKCRPVAFVFPGQGSQYPGMGRELYEAETVFREELDRCCELVAPHLGADADLRRWLLAPRNDRGAAEELRRTALAQPALFAVEYSLARLWMSWGVVPRAMLGHSIGEYVAACLAGVFSLEDGLSLVAARSRLMQELPPGAMLGVPLAARETEALIAAEPDLALAAVNGPAACVVSGPVEEVGALHRRLVADGIECRPLHTSHAFHSPAMDPILEPFAERVAAVERRPPCVPFLSNLTGTWIADDEATDPRYWSRHLRGTVRFAENLAALYKDSEMALVEVGPGSALSRLAKRQAPERIVVASLGGPKDSGPELETLLRAAARLWLAGGELDWAGFHAGRRRRVRLPTYPFERRRYWVDRGATPRRSLMTGQRKPLDEWTYVPTWKQFPLVGGSTRCQEGPWLVFQEGGGLGEALIEHLKQKGEEVISVGLGREFARIGPDSYLVDPESSEHYGALLDELAAGGNLPRTIVHLWLFTAAGERLSLRETQARGFLSLLVLAQALARMESHPIDLFVISDHLYDVTGTEDLDPGKSLAMGPIRVIPQELPHVSCRSVDLDPDGDVSRWTGQVLAELRWPSGDAVIGYRGHRRWIWSVAPIRLPDPGSDVLRHQGVYLVTGGLGGLGLVCARHLAETARARLILTGRSPIPPRETWEEKLNDPDCDARLREKIGAVLELEGLGSEVMVESVDVADREQMARVLSRARERFGPVHGVIHTAGVPAGGLIAIKSPEDAARILSPKVEGPIALLSIFRDQELDFMVFYSSLNALVGGVGQVDYCAANFFLGTLARSRPLGTKTPVIAIDWDGWPGLGMAAYAESLRKRKGWEYENVYRDGIRPDEGMLVLTRILGSGLPQVAVSTKDLETRLSFEERLNEKNLEVVFDRQRTTVSHSRPALDNPYVAPRDDVEEALCHIWQELLSVDQVGVEDNFFELGGDSLLATRVASRMRNQLGVRIPLDEILAEATVANLALAVAKRQAADLNEEELARMAEEIREISENELHALLENEG